MSTYNEETYVNFFTAEALLHTRVATLDRIRVFPQRLALENLSLAVALRVHKAIQKNINELNFMNDGEDEVSNLAAEYTEYRLNGGETLTAWDVIPAEYVETVKGSSVREASDNLLYELAETYLEMLPIRMKDMLVG